MCLYKYQAICVFARVIIFVKVCRDVFLRERMSDRRIYTVIGLYREREKENEKKRSVQKKPWLLVKDGNRCHLRSCCWWTEDRRCYLCCGSSSMRVHRYDNATITMCQKIQIYILCIYTYIYICLKCMCIYIFKYIYINMYI